MAGITKRHGRKLLVATVGVAAVSYVACSNNSRVEVTGNLVPPPQEDAASDASSDAAQDSGPVMEVVGNLVAPPIDASSAPIDASSDGADQ
jgi:hypothetical protein